MFLLRCLIYKVHAAFRRNIAIIQDFIPFVKCFFQKFSTRGPFCIRSNFLILPLSEALVKYFLLRSFNWRSLSFIGNLFKLPHFSLAVKPFLNFFNSALCRGAHRADSFVRIPDHSPFVNAFLQSFCFFRISTIRPPYFGTTSVHFGIHLSWVNAKSLFSIL